MLYFPLGFPRDAVILPPTSPYQPRPSIAVTSGMASYSRLTLVHPSLSSTPLMTAKDSASGTSYSSGREFKEIPTNIQDAILEAGTSMWTIPLCRSRSLKNQSLNSNMNDKGSSVFVCENPDEDEKLKEPDRKRIKLMSEAEITDGMQGLRTSGRREEGKCGRHNFRRCGIVVVSSDPDIDIGRTYIVDIDVKRSAKGEDKNHEIGVEESSRVSHEDEIFLTCRPSSEDATDDESGFDFESSTLACGVIKVKIEETSSPVNLQSKNSEPSIESFIVQVTPTQLRCIDPNNGEKLVASSLNLLELPAEQSPKTATASEVSNGAVNFLGTLLSTELSLIDAPLAVQSVVLSPWISVLFDDGTLKLWTASRMSLREIPRQYTNTSLDSSHKLLHLVSTISFPPELLKPLLYLNSFSIPLEKLPIYNNSLSRRSSHSIPLICDENATHQYETNDDQTRSFLIVVPFSNPTLFLFFSLNLFQIVFSYELKPNSIHELVEIRNEREKRVSFVNHNNEDGPLSHHSRRFDWGRMSNEARVAFDPISSSTPEENIVVTPVSNPMPGDEHLPCNQRILSAELFFIDYSGDVGPTLIIMIHNCPLLVFRAYLPFDLDNPFSESSEEFPFRFQRVYKDLVFVTGHQSLNLQNVTFSSNDQSPTSLESQSIVHPLHRGPSTSLVYSQSLSDSNDHHSRFPFFIGSVAASVIPISKSILSTHTILSVKYSNLLLILIFHHYSILLFLST